MVYEWTWLNGSVTYAKAYSAEERAEIESRCGKLVRCVRAI